MLTALKKIFNRKIESLELLVVDLPALKKARRRRFWRVCLWLVLCYILLIIMVALFQLGNISSAMLHGYRGQLAVRAAINLTKQTRLAEGYAQSTIGQSEFAEASKNLHTIDNSLLAKLPLVGGQVTEIRHLVDASELVSRSLQQGLAYGLKMRQLVSGASATNYTNFSTAEKQALLRYLYESAPELNGMRANLQLALMELDQLQLHGIFWPVKYQIFMLKDKLNLATTLLGEAVPMSQLLPALAGYPSKAHFLLILQNADELRPTGGFIGTYGILETLDGDITRLETHDIYHMDMPVKDRLTVRPPEPIRLYLNNKWYMRDANWSPDWPTAAQQIITFYNAENPLLLGANQINNFSGEFDGVIAINPSLVAELLRLVGPITIGSDVFNADNFTRLLEYKVEQGYAVDGVPSWQRKEIVGEIAKQLKIRLLNLPASRWPDILTLINTSFSQKRVLVWFTEPSLQEIVKTQNWAGNISETTGDYLSLIDANFASLKSDAVIDRSIYSSLGEVDGRLKVDLQLTYQHHGQKADWRTSRYKDYLRLYVPRGSQLINMTGVETAPVVTEELDKTVFGALLYVELNSQKTINISYYLPERLATQFRAGQYHLTWQRQPSSRLSTVRFDVRLPTGVKSISQTGGEISQSNQVISWRPNLTSDQELLLNY
jgi:hypothetical protein